MSVYCCPRSCSDTMSIITTPLTSFLLLQHHRPDILSIITTPPASLGLCLTFCLCLLPYIYSFSLSLFTMTDTLFIKTGNQRYVQCAHWGGRWTTSLQTTQNGHLLLFIGLGSGENILKNNALVLLHIFVNHSFMYYHSITREGHSKPTQCSLSLGC